jgi:hypothetical protein
MCLKDILNGGSFHLEWAHFMPFMMTRPISRNGGGDVAEKEAEQIERRAFDWRRFLEVALAAAIPIAVTWGQMQEKLEQASKTEVAVIAMQTQLTDIKATLAASIANSNNYATKSELLSIQLKIQEMLIEERKREKR